MSEQIGLRGLDTDHPDLWEGIRKVRNYTMCTNVLNTLCNNARHGSFPLHTSQVFLFLFVFMNHQEAFNHLKWDDVGAAWSSCERKRTHTLRSVIDLVDLLVWTCCD